MVASCESTDPTITRIMNPGRGCGVLKAGERKRSFPVDCCLKKSIERYGRRILGSFRPQIRLPDIDYSAWTYSLRAACAACLAFYISFSLNLDGSHWALTTCYIVGSERESGRILAKSVARIVGTLVGATASFVLVNAFAQEGVLFICWFAVWLSVCVFFSHHERGYWAYAWVLSGYTTAIVGIPAALTPVLAFDIISSRAENIIIGVLCMGTVSMIALPESVRPRLVKLVKATDQELFQLLSSCLCNCLARWRHLSHLGGPRILSIRHRTESRSSYCGSVQRHVDCRRTDLSYYILSHAADGRVRYVRSGPLAFSILWCWDRQLLAPAR
jgi:hypothetical protein